MSAPWVAFRVDASLDMGSGHWMRCLTLADALATRGIHSVFLSDQVPPALAERTRWAGYPLHRLEPARKGNRNGTYAHSHWLATDELSDAQAVVGVLATAMSQFGGAPLWIVVDHYGLAKPWEESVSVIAPVFAIDDLADRPHAAALLLDSGLDRRTEDYSALVPESCVRLVGPAYALLRPEFSAWRPASLERRRKITEVNRLLITLGGGDPGNATESVLNALALVSVKPSFRATLVMGGAAPAIARIGERALQLPFPVELVVDVDDMARRMAEADLAIGAAGNTAWERCCLGLPSLMLVLADNQRPIARALDRAGAATALASPGQLAEQWSNLVDSARLARQSQTAADLVDGEGAGRVLSALLDEPGNETPHHV